MCRVLCHYMFFVCHMHCVFLCCGLERKAEWILSKPANAFRRSVISMHASCSPSSYACFSYMHCFSFSCELERKGRWTRSKTVKPSRFSAAHYVIVCCFLNVICAVLLCCEFVQKGSWIWSKPAKSSGCSITSMCHALSLSDVL